MSTLVAELKTRHPQPPQAQSHQTISRQAHRAEPYDPPLTHKRMSWEEYLALPPQPKAEWINGEAIIMMAPARIVHNEVADNIFFILRLKLRNVSVNRETGFRVADGGRVPDVIVTSQRPTDDIWVTTPPLIVVEVLSKSTREQDLVTKSAEYAKAGAEQYWLADPDAKWLEVRENNKGSWQTIATLNQLNQRAPVAIPNHGTIELEFNEVFNS